MASLKVLDPENGQVESLLGTGLGADKQGAIIDRVAQRLIHMNTIADESRSPTFTFFGNPDFLFEEGEGGTTVGAAGPGFIWNHGDIQPEIARTFIAIAGPECKTSALRRRWISSVTMSTCGRRYCPPVCATI